LVVYTDGCALGNGREGARAGIGVWFGPNDPRNVSKALEGKATNNRAEIMAVVELLEQTQDDVQDMKIYTDSTYVRNAMTKWISQWRINGWIDSKGMPVKNQDLLRRLDTLLTAAKERKKLHIPGHRGYRGNEEADRLANLGAAASRPSG
ncbi:MAG: ribonuclease H-like domain-containing protein, partial [Piptocephalis tieghemiana]